MATVNILVSARNQTQAAFASVNAQMRAMSNNVTTLTRNMLAQSRQVSSVAGAYRDANGLWRNANGTLLTQRHTVTQVTTAFGHMANAARAAGRQVGNTLTSMRDMANAAGPAIAQMGAKIAGLLTVAVPVAGVLADLSGAVMLLAPAAVAAGAAVLTLKLGTRGFGDAVKAGLSGDVDKFRDALKKLSPQAAGTANAIVQIARHWRGLQKTVQDRLFTNLGRTLLDTQNALKPIADRWLPKIAEGFNAAAQGLGKLFRESAESGQLDRIMAGVSTAISGILSSMTPLTQAFLDFAEVASPTFGGLGTSVKGMADRFAEWVRQLKEDGTLKNWLDKAKDAFDKVKLIGDEAKRVVVGFFTGSQQSSKDFLDSVHTNMQKLADWVESEDGKAFIRFWGDVANAISDAVVQLQRLRDLMGLGLPIWQPKQYTPPDKRSPSSSGGAGGGSGGGGMKFRASGGIASGLTMVGERGRELLDLPGGTRVIPNGTTEAMMSRSGRQAVTVNITVASARGGVGDPYAEAFLSLLRTGRLQLRVDGGGKVMAARV